MTIEDRLRATTEAVTASMHPVRPLDLHPDEAGARQPAGRRRARPPRGRPGWLVPLAAALAVVAVAATLAVVRGLSGPDSGSHPAPTATSTSITPTSAGVPPYYVEINDVGGPVIPGVPKGAVVIGDTSTGKRLRIFMPAQGTAFRTVAGSSDGRTFVLQAAPTTSDSPIAKAQDTWDVIRLTPGISQLVPVTRPLTTVSMVGKDLEGVAVSPDGGTLALLYQAIKVETVHGGMQVNVAAGPATLRTYSLATRRLLRTWTAPAADSTAANFADLTWLNDNDTVAFVYPNMSARRYYRILNTTHPGSGLISDSRVAFTVPPGHTCDSQLLMTPDDKSIICGNFALNSGWCATGQLAFTAYSMTTATLYRYQSGCSSGTATVIWAKSATLAIGWFAISQPGKAAQPIMNEIGVITPGKFTPLAGIVVGTGGYEEPSDIAF